jgi:integrase
MTPSCSVPPGGATRIRPLNLDPQGPVLLTDPALDGRSGSNRAPHALSQIHAPDDGVAVRCFLQEYRSSTGTHKVYAKECERLLLWCWNVHRKAFSDLDRTDFEAYFSFLMDPQPSEVWCGPKAPRSSESWRPFVGPLRDSALRTAASVIKSCLNYLVDAGHLRGNPMALMRQMGRKLQRAGESRASRTTDSADKVERFLDEDMWQAVHQVVQSMPTDEPLQVKAQERIRFVLSFLYLLAPRAAELEHGTMAGFRMENGLWWWHVRGKGDKLAKIPVPDDMRDALLRYRQHLGLSPVPRRNETTPLLCSLDNPPRPVTARWLNKLLKSVFHRAAELIENDRPDQADRLRQASAHWGRHTGISRMDLAGIEARLVQKSARHSDPRTTQRYIHDEDKRWHEQAQKHTLSWSEAPSRDSPPPAKKA